jgi:hypothetical protein
MCSNTDLSSYSADANDLEDFKYAFIVDSSPFFSADRKAVYKCSDFLGSFFWVVYLLGLVHARVRRDVSVRLI